MKKLIDVDLIVGLRHGFHQGRACYAPHRDEAAFQDVWARDCMAYQRPVDYVRGFTRGFSEGWAGAALEKRGTRP